MRHVPTDAEKKLWSCLRDRQLGGIKFRRQVPIEGFIVDFYCLEHQLVIELDGGQHEDSESIVYDKQRTATLNGLGIYVMRFSNVDVLKDTDLVLTEILQVIEQNPHPSPLPAYRARG